MSTSIVKCRHIGTEFGLSWSKCKKIRTNSHDLGSKSIRSNYNRNRIRFMHNQTIVSTKINISNSFVQNIQLDMATTVAFRRKRKHEKDRKMLSFGTQTIQAEKINCIFIIKLIEYGVKLKWHFILVLLFFLALRISFIAQAKRCAECMLTKLQQRKVKHFTNIVCLSFLRICFV